MIDRWQINRYNSKQYIVIMYECYENKGQFQTWIWECCSVIGAQKGWYIWEKKES